jgi:hypothetical protein
MCFPPSPFVFPARHPNAMLIVTELPKAFKCVCTAKPASLFNISCFISRLGLDEQLLLMGILTRMYKLADYVQWMAQREKECERNGKGA